MTDDASTDDIISQLSTRVLSDDELSYVLECLAVSARHHQGEGQRELP